MAIGMFLAPKPKMPEGPKPSALGDFTAPTATEGRVLPVIMGTCKLSAPNVTWYGDLRVEPITERVKTGPCDSEDITKGYRYFIGMDLTLCLGPIDALTEIWIGEKQAWTGTLTGESSSTINQWNLFGGDEKEGGIYGTFDFYPGSTTQGANSYLQSKIGESIPAYRNIAHLVFRQGYIGTTSYLKPWTFVVRRFPKALGSGYHNINGDANPVEMIFEILTNNLWGLGMSPNMIDIPNFKSIAQKLSSEGFGLSMVFDSQKSAREIIQEIERHIDGTLFTDPETGKLKMILIRGDYNPNTVLELNPSNTVSVEISKDSWPETYNEVKVKYIDRSAGFKEKYAQVQDIANLYIQGGEIISQTVDFHGVSNAQTAQNLAGRTLRLLSYPLDKIRVITNRVGYELFPGSIFKLNWPPLGINGKIYRVARPKYGTLENGEIEIEAVEDFFGLGEATFVAPPPSNWVDPITAPLTKIVYQSAQEANYFWQKATRWVAIGAVRPSPLCIGYDVYTRLPGDVYRLTNQISTFTPGGVLVADYPKNTDSVDQTGFYCIEAMDLNLLKSITSADLYKGINLLTINGELMAWQNVTFDQEKKQYKITGIVRGVLDTLPQDHKAGDLVGFISYGIGLTSIEPYNSDLTIDIKLCPKTLKETLPLDQATAFSFTTNSRAWKPYPPGNFCLNGKLWPGLAITGTAALTWAHRSRLYGDLVSQSGGNVASEPEGSYTITVKINGTTKKTLADQKGTSFSYTCADRITDGGIGPVTLEIVAVNGSYQSVNRSHTFIMAGYGMAYGQSYGGC